MSDSNLPESEWEALAIPQLLQETQEALQERARRNNRTVHEEAEDIIRTHLEDASKRAD